MTPHDLHKLRVVHVDGEFLTYANRELGVERRPPLLVDLTNQPHQIVVSFAAQEKVVMVIAPVLESYWRSSVRGKRSRCITANRRGQGLEGMPNGADDFVHGIVHTQRKAIHGHLGWVVELG